MFTYIAPEFVEALKPLAADRWVTDTSPDISSKPLGEKRKDHLTPLQWVTARLRSLIGL
jgi:hypothetical protein